ncbi:zinc ribbon domain-containing protein YjdM [Acidocella sp.]|uniref:zinc ribbon domain-containing protein YjdM n=1 Tax=Acidocella sp. TaxID=50710 RepID=UPI00260C60E5|nr:zinc ribbon domain-containing protein YjdM [Acidocella sp.]
METPLPPCPQCTLDDVSLQGTHYLCNTCGHEWPAELAADEELVRDANGNILASGDAVVLIKDLKVKGSSTVLKLGTKLKGIRVVGGGDHAVEHGGYMLKQAFLRKV